MDSIKKNLTNIVVIIGLIGSIGAGFTKYGELTTKIEALEGASKGIDMSFLSEIKVLEEKVNKLENADTSHTHKVGDHKHEEHSHTISLINKKEIDLLKVQIEEIKVKASNPLAN